MPKEKDIGREVLRNAFEAWIDEGQPLAFLGQLIITEVNLTVEKAVRDAQYGTLPFPPLPSVCCGRCDQWVRAHDCLVSFDGHMQARFGICKMLKEQWPDKMGNWVTPAHSSTGCEWFIELGEG